MRLKEKAERLPPRDPKGGRPTQELATRLGIHILDVALEQFIAHGPEGTSMEAIAAAANVSKRTLYSRFESKIGLVYAVLDHGLERLTKPIKSLSLKGSLHEQLFTVARKMLDASLKHETIGLEALAYWVIDRHPRPGKEAEIEIHGGTQLIRSILANAVERQEASVPDPEFLPPLLFDALVICPRHRILRRRSLANTRGAKDEYLEKTLHILLKGIAMPRTEQ